MLPLNPFRKLVSLLPDPPLLVGVVESLTDTGAVILLPDGGRLTARGEAIQGQSVFVRDGVIEGQAPALSVVVIEV